MQTVPSTMHWASSYVLFDSTKVQKEFHMESKQVRVRAQSITFTCPYIVLSEAFFLFKLNIFFSKTFKYYSN